MSRRPRPEQKPGQEAPKLNLITPDALDFVTFCLDPKSRVSLLNGVSMVFPQHVPTSPPPHPPFMQSLHEINRTLIGYVNEAVEFITTRALDRGSDVLEEEDVDAWLASVGQLDDLNRQEREFCEAVRSYREANGLSTDPVSLASLLPTGVLPSTGPARSGGTRQEAEPGRTTRAKGVAPPPEPSCDDDERASTPPILAASRGKSRLQESEAADSGAPEDASPDAQAGASASVPAGAPGAGESPDSSGARGSQSASQEDQQGPRPGDSDALGNGDAAASDGRGPAFTNLSGDAQGGDSAAVEGAEPAGPVAGEPPAEEDADLAEGDEESGGSEGNEDSEEKEKDDEGDEGGKHSQGAVPAENSERPEQLEQPERPEQSEQAEGPKSANPIDHTSDHQDSANP